MGYVRRHELLRAGDRVGLAVSGGADSVALLRLMLELRAELGVVLAVVHFNHQIRGGDAHADQRFVAELARTYGLDFHCDSGDTPGFAREHRLSLEAAGRKLRYGFFRKLLAGTVSTVATAHTMDDQAETVLLRLMRGAGTRGLVGIFPKLPVASGQLPEGQHPGEGGNGKIVRPLLNLRRAELRAYLDAVKQPWREDASNLDVKHTRNRLRQQLLPLIEREFNPSIVPVLAEMAEIARAEEEYWESEIAGLLPATGEGLSTSLVKGLPPALQRRLIREFAGRFGRALEFRHVEKVRAAAGSVQPLESKYVEVPDGLLTCTARELTFGRRGQCKNPGGYEYHLPVPGEVRIAEIGKLLKVSRLPAAQAGPGYNQRQLLDIRRLAPELVVRNWQPGDRFWPAHSKSPKKLKELLLRHRIGQPERARWPVVVSNEVIVWVPGLGTATGYQPGLESPEVAVIEVVIADHRPR